MKRAFHETDVVAHKGAHLKSANTFLLNLIQRYIGETGSGQNRPLIECYVN